MILSSAVFSVPLVGVKQIRCFLEHTSRNTMAAPETYLFLKHSTNCHMKFRPQLLQKHSEYPCMYVSRNTVKYTNSWFFLYAVRQGFLSPHAMQKAYFLRYGKKRYRPFFIQLFFQIFLRRRNGTYMCGLHIDFQRQDIW